MTGGNLSYVSLTAETFKDEILENLHPVVVLFMTESNGPCHSVDPMLVKSVATNKGKFKLAKLDVEKEVGLAGQYRIRDLPTVLFFKNGVVVDFLVGVFQKKELESRLQTLFPVDP